MGRLPGPLPSLPTPYPALSVFTALVTTCHCSVYLYQIISFLLECKSVWAPPDSTHSSLYPPNPMWCSGRTRWRKWAEPTELCGSVSLGLSALQTAKSSCIFHVRLSALCTKCFTVMISVNSTGEKQGHSPHVTQPGSES